jgi:hypothetical protein
LSARSAHIFCPERSPDRLTFQRQFRTVETAVQLTPKWLFVFARPTHLIKDEDVNLEELQVRVYAPKTRQTRWRLAPFSEETALVLAN